MASMPVSWLSDNANANYLTLQSVRERSIPLGTRDFIQGVFNSLYTLEAYISMCCIVVYTVSCHIQDYMTAA